jgi:hypothetical protein
LWNRFRLVQADLNDRLPMNGSTRDLDSLLPCWILASAFAAAQLNPRAERPACTSSSEPDQSHAFTHWSAVGGFWLHAGYRQLRLRHHSPAGCRIASTTSAASTAARTW